MLHYVYWLRIPAHTDMFTEGYIGITSNPKERFSTHRHRQKNPHLANAFAKYGDDITMQILMEDTEYDCLDVENCFRPTERIGWNILAGGGKPPIVHLSGELNGMYGKPSYWKDKKNPDMSERQRGEDNHMYGRTGDQHHRFGAIGLWHGKENPDHSKRMMGEGNPNYGKKGTDHPLYGRKKSPESIEHMKRTIAEKGHIYKHRFKGVYFVPEFNKYRAVAYLDNGKTKGVGFHDTPELANEAIQNYYKSGCHVPRRDRRKKRECVYKYGFKGVYFVPEYNKFRGVVTLENGKKKGVGFHDTPELANEAIQNYKAANLHCDELALAA